MHSQTLEYVEATWLNHMMGFSKVPYQQTPNSLPWLNDEYFREVLHRSHD